MKKTEEVTTVIIDDPTIAALAEILGLKPRQYVKQNTPKVLIAYEVEGDFTKVLDALQTNMHIPIRSYIETLRALRSNLFLLKSASAGMRSVEILRDCMVNGEPVGAGSIMMLKPGDFSVLVQEGIARPTQRGDRMLQVTD